MSFKVVETKTLLEALSDGAGLTLVSKDHSNDDRSGWRQKLRAVFFDHAWLVKNGRFPTEAEAEAKWFEEHPDGYHALEPEVLKEEVIDVPIKRGRPKGSKTHKKVGTRRVRAKPAPKKSRVGKQTIPVIPPELWRTPRITGSRNKVRKNEVFGGEYFTRRWNAFVKDVQGRLFKTYNYLLNYNAISGVMRAFVDSIFGELSEGKNCELPGVGVLYPQVGRNVVKNNLTGKVYRKILIKFKTSATLTSHYTERREILALELIEKAARFGYEVVSNGGFRKLKPDGTYEIVRKLPDEVRKAPDVPPSIREPEAPDDMFS